MAETWKVFPSLIFFLYLVRVTHGPVLKHASFIYAFFFFLNQSVLNINAIQSFVATFWIFIFWLQNCESGFLPMANWKKLLAKLTVFYLNCCREGKRMTDSRLRAKPNLSTFRTFALQGLMFWTLPTLHRTTNAAVTLTWADLSKDNPCFLIDGVKTLSSSNSF